MLILLFEQIITIIIEKCEVHELITNTLYSFRDTIALLQCCSVKAIVSQTVGSFRTYALPLELSYSHSLSIYYPHISKVFK